MVMKVKELVRRKECFGEDPNIFTREHRLSSKEIELYGKFGHLEDRPLGEYIKQSNLVSRNVLVYVNEGYDGNYTGWNSSSNERARGYELILLSLSSFPRDTAQEEVQELADLVSRDLLGLIEGEILNQITSVQGKPCQSNCSINARISHMLEFCGVSLRLVGKITNKEEVYGIIRAYAVNLTEGVTVLGVNNGN